MTSQDDPDGATRGTTRRTLLAASATVVAGAVAGCAGQSGDGGGTATSTATSTATETATETTTEADAASVSEPETPVPEDATCAVCNMNAAKYPEWNAQLSVAGGAHVHFCSPGCLTAYHADPGHFDEERTGDDIANVWARDYTSKELVDGTTASYVLEMNADRIDAPMMKNPVPFASEADAMAYVDQYDDLTAHDVVSLSAFDVALARTFRKRFLPETEQNAITEPVSVPEDAECAVCGMTAAKFPEWNAQLSTESGDRAHFCSPGCLTAYYADPGHFTDEVAQADIVGVWAHDYASKELVDGVAAQYVLEMNADRIDAPMMKNPLPFANSADAQSYIDQYDDLTSEDVVTLQAFDRELAEAYRSKFFSENTNN